MKISVVMPSYNQRPFLEEAVSSVLGQSGDFALELLVVDGASTDGSVDLLRSIKDERLRWFSEPDQGQADAINKGLVRATGDVFGWLNSDDRYVPGALETVTETFAGNPAAGWLVGKVSIIDVEGRQIRRFVTRYRNRALRRYRYRRLLRQNFVPQMGVFWRRQLGAAVGALDTSLHYAMDYDLWLRMGARCEPYILDRTVAQFRIHDTSKTCGGSPAQFREQFLVASRYFNEDLLSRWAHRFNISKVLWAYRILRLLGW